MQTWIILIVITIMTSLGDYCIKSATLTRAGLAAPIFWAGALFYGLPAIGWFFLMQSQSLAAVGVFYSAATLVLLAALGVVVFREPFGAREALGVALALASVAVMASK